MNILARGALTLFLFTIWSTQSTAAVITSSCISDTFDVEEYDPFTDSYYVLYTQTVSTTCTTTTTHQLLGTLQLMIQSVRLLA